MSGPKLLIYSVSGSTPPQASEERRSNGNSLPFRMSALGL
jgi:hypothetical protein